MVTEYGMSEELGPLRLGQPRGEVFLGRDFATTPDYSEQVAARIDGEVRRLVEHARDVARGIIETNRAVLDQLAAELVEHETVDVDRVAEIFAPVEPYRGDGLQRTPGRVARMYAEIFRGLYENPASHLTVTFEADHDEMVLVRDIPLYGACEHHLIPFAGRAHVAYIPGRDGRITGLSKIARLVEGFARRPQVQERLTTQIADALPEVLEPDGVLVMIDAEHLSMSLRGVKKP